MVLGKEELPDKIGLSSDLVGGQVMYTLKSATLIPPDGKIVFAVPIDMEWITVAISDQAGNIMLKMPIERKEHLKGGVIARTFWDGRFIGWKGEGTGKPFRADPSRGNYYYTVVGEEKVEVQLPEITPQELPPPTEVFEETTTTTPTPPWLWAVIAFGVLLLLSPFPKGGRGI